MVRRAREREAWVFERIFVSRVLWCGVSFVRAFPPREASKVLFPGRC